MESPNQANQEQLVKLKFIIDGLEHHEPFKKFIELFDEDCQRADETWHNCIVEDEAGRNLFYQLRASKLSIINIKNKIQELKNEIEFIEDEMKENKNTE